MATPTPAPQPAPAPAIPVTPDPGWKTTEGWLSLLVVILGALPTTVLTNSPTAIKIAGMIGVFVQAIWYQGNRTSLKRAHVLASAQAPANSNRAATAASAIATAALVALAVACSSTTAQAIKQDVGSAGSAFLQCEGVNLEQDVGDLSLLATIAKDLVGANYVQAIADAITTLGSQAVGCAMLAIKDVSSAGKTSGAAALTPIEARALEMIDKYGWKRAPPSAKSTTAAGGPAR